MKTQNNEDAWLDQSIKCNLFTAACALKEACEQTDHVRKVSYSKKTIADLQDAVTWLNQKTFSAN